MKQTFTYIVSWTISIAALPCHSDFIKSIISGNRKFCFETDKKEFTIGFLNRDSAILVYKNAVSSDLKPKLDSIPNK